MKMSTVESPSTSQKPMDTLHTNRADAAWKPLYRIGGVCALLAAVLAIVQSGIEFIGVILMGSVVPSTVIGWFTLLHTNRLLGLTELTVLQIPLFALVIPMFLALYVALRRASPSLMTIAVPLGLVGIAVYLSTNTGLSLLSLSDQYAAATTEAQRSMFEASGQALLALYQRTGIGVGVFLLNVAVLLISAVMLRSHVFSKVTAAVGVLAGAIGFAYYIDFAVPEKAIFLLEFSGALFVIWIVLISRRLFLLSHRNGSREQVAAGAAQQKEQEHENPHSRHVP